MGIDTPLNQAEITVGVVDTTDSPINPAKEDGNLKTISDRTPALGQTGMAASSPVVIAANQSSVPVAAGQTGDWIVGITGTVPLPTGAATETSLAKLTIPLGATLDANTMVLAGASVSSVVPGYTAGTIQPLSQDTNGNLRVLASIGDRVRPTTYSASSGPVTISTAATDVFAIYGSATKTIKVTKIALTCYRQAANGEWFYLKRRSTANTGGTSSSRTKVPHDTSNAAATATVLSYTVNPTALGTEVGDIDVQRYGIPSASSVPADSEFVLFEAPDRIQALVLRGDTQWLTINLNGITISGNVFSFNVTWTEE